MVFSVVGIKDTLWKADKIVSMSKIVLREVIEKPGEKLGSSRDLEKSFKSRTILAALGEVVGQSWP